MKILFVGNGFLDTDSYPDPNQGGSVQTWELSKELANRGHEVFVVRRSNSEGKEIVEDVNLLSIKFRGIEKILQARFMSVPFHVARMFSSFYFSRKSLKFIQTINPDIICLIDRFSGIFPASVATPKLYIMHVPEALEFFKPYAIHANKLNSVLFYIKKSLENAIMHKVDKIVVLNSYIEKYLENAGFSNMVKIPNGVNLNEFSDKGDQNYILYAGRFDWNKNVVSLVNAFQRIRTDYPLYLIGGGPEEPRIRNAIIQKKLGKKVFIVPTLPRRELMKIMNKCSVFVLPSLFEVFNGAIMEAMAAGKPVIARANMGTSDVITDGYNGYLYESEEKLVEYLELLIYDKNLRNKIGNNARKIVEKNYAFSQISSMYEKLFGQMI